MTNKPSRAPAAANAGARDKSKPRLALTLQFSRFHNLAAHRAALTRAAVASWIGSALTQPAQLAVRVVAEDEGKALNLHYRGKDYATNVLTFSYDQGPTILADLVLCAPIVEQQARAQGKTLRAHYAHLLIHATLHAQGYEHEFDECSALEMEALEILLLGSLGFANPY